LKDFNIKSKITDFYTSASIASSEITRIKKEANIYVIGETGLKQELTALGHKIISHPANYTNIDFVVVGLDREFNYNKLAIAQRCILEGKAKFYATNADATLPVANGLKPGAGSMVNALAICIDNEPIRIFGKPEPFGIELILRDTNTPLEKVCIFGDRLNTDILAGNRANITTLAVLTGVTTREMIESLKNEVNNSKSPNTNLLPDLIINNLTEIFKNFQG